MALAVGTIVAAACGAQGDGNGGDSEDLGEGQSAIVQSLGGEAEPNASVAQATPLPNNDCVVRGSVNPTTDADFYSFTANAGDKVYVATMGAGSTVATSGDTRLQLIASDGTTVIDADDDNGAQGTFSSTIAGRTIPASGTYYVKVDGFNGTTVIRPYDLHFRVQTSVQKAEAEPNDSVGTATPITTAGRVTGALSALSDIDIYAITLNAGDTIFASLDNDPERDGTNTSSKLGIGLFNNKFMVIDDTTTSVTFDGTFTATSEAQFMTVKTAGTYYVEVIGQTSGTASTYELSVSVHPRASQAGCLTFTNNTPVVLPSAAATYQSVLTIPAQGVPFRVGSATVSVNLDHTGMTDLDVGLLAPAPGNNYMSLFTDVGSTVETKLDLDFDQTAGLPIAASTTHFNANGDVLQGWMAMPENVYTLEWLNGVDAVGNWTLVLRDDTAASGSGTLNSWSMTVCPMPAPTCPPGTTLTTVFSTDFEANDGSFTHTGTADEWAYGAPTLGAAPIVGCASGTSCWKTDLTGGYNASSSQDLLSPVVNLAGISGPIHAIWSHSYQMETATNDHYVVSVENPGPANAKPIFQHLGATMTDSIGSPATTVQQSKAWGAVDSDISAYAGQQVQLRFHLDSNSSTHLAGVAVDDVTIVGCLPAVCGDAVPNGLEQCDDGNAVDGDGCDTNCKFTACGNGILTAGETCDDGNLGAGDGCSPACAPELGFTCTPTSPSVCTGDCGDGIQVGGEACDDGNGGGR
jgi:cysteine-rich repeat protein